MKNFCDVDKSPPLLERSFKATTKLSRELPTNLEIESIPVAELSSWVEYIHAIQALLHPPIYLFRLLF